MLDNPSPLLGERVAIPQSRESRVRGSAHTMIIKNYADTTVGSNTQMNVTDST